MCCPNPNPSFPSLRLVVQSEAPSSNDALPHNAREEHAAPPAPLRPAPPLVTKLIKDVEGTCSGRHGFVVAITGVEDIGKGLIRKGTGFVTFPVKYQCVVFRPFKGEILEAVVTMVNKMGFFAEAGPMQIFVSNHLIPDDMEFQSGDTPNYTTSDGSVKISKYSEVRLKIIGTRLMPLKFFALVP